MEHMLKYKYISSIQGNDKDTGLNWKLASNSLVLMPKPFCESWLMETQLIPNYHYVLLNDDFSNLMEKYEWCQKHPGECKQIIQNAHKYINMFTDEKYEQRLEMDVIKTYLQYNNI